MAHQLKFIFILIFLISCSNKKSNPSSSNLEKSNTDLNKNSKYQEEKPFDFHKKISLGNYEGKIGDNLNVLFHLENTEGKISGFYFYEKTGVDIKVVGGVFENELLAYELNFKSDTLAILKGIINESSINGKWINSKTQKEYPLILNKTKKKIEALPNNVAGTYFDNVCNITLEISKSKGEYYYNYSSDERQLKGKVIFSRDEDLFLVLDNIEYAEDYFDISLPEENEAKRKEFEKLRKIGKRQIGIDCYWSAEEIIIQNYGNAMNYYIKLYDCGEKYIHLIKQ